MAHVPKKVINKKEYTSILHYALPQPNQKDERNPS